MEPQYLEKTFIAQLDSLEAILAWIRSYAPITGLDVTEWNKVEVALEEALVNIINHAYSKQEGWIFLSCSIVPKRKIEITIKDKGKPFNPEEKTGAAITQAPIEKLPIGGLGLLFMHEYMDEIRYERQNPYNVLTLIKFC